jgi:hypothetical protein
MTVIERSEWSSDISGMLSSPLVRDGGLLVSVVGVSASEPGCSVAVAISHDRVSWLQPDDGTVVSITTDAVAEVEFVRLDAPPRPVYFDVKVHADRGEVAVVVDGEREQRPVGTVRAAALHRHLHTVRLTDHDATQLRAAFRAVAVRRATQLVSPSTTPSAPTGVSVMPWC